MARPATQAERLAPLDYDYEERAAIVEYEAGLPRDEAERLARQMEQQRKAQEETWPRT